MSKGVFRALFDDSLNSGSGPDAEKFVAFGSELQSVEIEGGRLVLDKGRPESRDRRRLVSSGTGVAETVARPAEAPAAPRARPSVRLRNLLLSRRTLRRRPPRRFAAAPAPAGPGSSRPVPRARRAGPSRCASRRRSTALNALGSGSAGPVTLRIEQGWVTVTGRRSARGGGMLVGGAILLSLGAVLADLGLGIAVRATSNSDMGAAFSCMGLGTVLLVPVSCSIWSPGTAR